MYKYVILLLGLVNIKVIALLFFELLNTTDSQELIIEAINLTVRGEQVS